jgi:hypothetical protein
MDAVPAVRSDRLTGPSLTRTVQVARAPYIRGHLGRFVRV